MPLLKAPTAPPSQDLAFTATEISSTQLVTQKEVKPKKQPITIGQLLPPTLAVSSTGTTAPRVDGEQKEEDDNMGGDDGLEEPEDEDIFGTVPPPKVTAKFSVVAQAAAQAPPAWMKCLHP